MTRSHVWFMAFAALVPGCSSETTTEQDPPDPSVVDGYEPATIDADSIDQVAELSAPQIFATGLTGFAAGGVAGDVAACPKTTESETQTILEGGCTDEGGQTWHGKAISNANGITYDGFGFTGEDPCGEGETAPTELTLDGHATLSSTTGEVVSFSVELELTVVEVDEETCAPTGASGAFDYDGTVVSPSGNIDTEEPSTWNGSGQVALDGFGRVDVATVDEVVDDAICESEAISGETTVRSDSGGEVVIAYDGATDCDPESTVTWSLDGASQGEISGVSCSAGGKPASGQTLGLLGLIAGLALARRRRS